MMPMQFGPTMRSRWGFAAARVACCNVRAPLTDLAETGGNDDGRTRTPLGQDHRSDPATVSGGVDDDREVWSLRQARDIPVDRQTHTIFAMMRVDKHQLAGKPATTQVAQETTPPTEPGRGVSADRRERSWFEQLVEITNGHWPLSVIQASTRTAVLCGLGKVDPRSESWFTRSATRPNFTWVMLKSLK